MPNILIMPTRLRHRPGRYREILSAAVGMTFIVFIAQYVAAISAVLGLILMQALNNGLSLAGVKGDGTIVVIGVILIVAVLLANLVRRT